MTEKDVQLYLKQLFLSHKYHITNQYIFSPNWESDYFSVTSAQYCYEVEIKLSTQDFRKDFTKQKHFYFQQYKDEFFIKPGEINNIYDGEKWLTVKSELEYIPRNKAILPNKFYYCCPKNLLYKSEIPSYAGLIYVGEGIVKSAPFIHKTKLDMGNLLLDKFYYKSLYLQSENNQLKQELQKLNEHVGLSNTEIGTQRQ